MNIRLGILMLAVVVQSVVAQAGKEAIQFVVVIPSYKNIQWYQRNLDSLMMQENTYSNWRAIYIDDCSPDGTGDAVYAYVHERGFDHKITVIKNETRIGALANIYNAVLMCDEHEVVCTLDGDDSFAVDNVFCILRDLYADSRVWMTYGQYRECPSGKRGQCMPIPHWVMERKLLRDMPWITSHLRTFYARLFKKIQRADLLLQGKFFPMAWDLAFMLPMLEMAGEEHVAFNPIIVYDYNMENPLNDFKKNRDLQVRIEFYIRNLPAYSQLDFLFDSSLGSEKNIQPVA